MAISLRSSTRVLSLLQINGSYGTEPFRLWHAIKSNTPLSEAMKEDEKDFSNIVGGGKVWRGCIGALDGISTAIKKPSYTELPGRRAWFNRKGHHPVDMQVHRSSIALNLEP
jgi:hypothetical protein